MVTVIFILCAIGSLTGPVLGTGSLYDPPSRPVMWKYGYETEKNYNYMQLNCGGEKQPKDGPKQCGVCGDYVNGTRDHELGGMYGAGVIGRYYPAGIKEIQVNVELLAFEEGFFEFRLCPANNRPVTQACLDEYLLPIKQGYLSGTPFRFYPKSAGDYRLVIAVPPKMKCKRCVLQWRYHTGNSWGTDPKTGEEGKGFGPQEEFYNCADIRIGGEIPATVLANPFFAPPDGSGPLVSKATGGGGTKTKTLKPTIVDGTNPDKTGIVVKPSKAGANEPVATLTIDTSANAEWLSKIEGGPRAFNTGTGLAGVEVPALSEATAHADVQSSISSSSSVKATGVQTGIDDIATLNIQTGVSAISETGTNAAVDKVGISDVGSISDMRAKIVTEPAGGERTATLTIHQSGGLHDQSIGMKILDQAPPSSNVNVGALDLTNTFDAGVSVDRDIHTEFGSSGGMTGSAHKTVDIHTSDQSGQLDSTKTVISTVSRTNEQTVANDISGAAQDMKNAQLNIQPNQVPSTINVAVDNTINTVSDMTLEPGSADMSMNVDSHNQIDVVNRANVVQSLPNVNSLSDQTLMMNVGIDNTVNVDTGVSVEQPLMDLSMNVDSQTRFVDTVDVITTKPAVSLNSGTDFTGKADISNFGGRVDQPYIDAAPSATDVAVNVGLVRDATIATTTKGDMIGDPASIVIKSEFGSTNIVADKTDTANVDIIADQPYVDAVSSETVNVGSAQDANIAISSKSDIINDPATIVVSSNLEKTADAVGGSDASNIGVLVDQPYVDPMPSETVNIDFVQETQVGTSPAKSDITVDTANVTVKTNLGSTDVKSFVETLSNGEAGRMALETSMNRVDIGMTQLPGTDPVLNIDPPETMPPIFVPPAVDQPVANVVSSGNGVIDNSAPVNNIVNDQTVTKTVFSNTAMSDSGPIFVNDNKIDLITTSPKDKQMIVDSSTASDNTLSRVAATIDKIIESNIASISANENISPTDTVLNTENRNVISVDSIAGTSGQSDGFSISRIDASGIPVDSSMAVDTNINIASTSVNENISPLDTVLKTENRNVMNVDSIAGTSGQSDGISISRIDASGIPVDSSMAVATNINMKPIIFNKMDTAVSVDSSIIAPKTDEIIDAPMKIPPLTETFATVKGARENIVLETNLLTEQQTSPESSPAGTNIIVDQPPVNTGSLPIDAPKKVTVSEGTSANLASQTNEIIRITKTSTKTEVKPAFDITIKTESPPKTDNRLTASSTRIENNDVAITNVLPSQPSESNVNYTVAVATGGATENINTVMKDVRTAVLDKPAEIKSQINNFNLNTIPDEKAMDSNIQIGPDGVLRPSFGPRVDRTTQFRNLNRSPITDNIGSNTADVSGRSIRPVSNSDVPNGLIPGGNVRIVVDPRTGSESRVQSIRVSSTTRTGRQGASVANAAQTGPSTIVTETRRVNINGGMSQGVSDSSSSVSSTAENRATVNGEGSASRGGSVSSTSSSSSMSSSVSSRSESRPSTNGRIVRITTIRGRRPSTTGGSSRTRTATLTVPGNGARRNGVSGTRRGDFRSRVFSTDRRRMETPRFDPRFGRPITTGPIGAAGFRPMVGGIPGGPVDAGIASGGGFGGMPPFLPGGDPMFTGPAFDGRGGSFGPIRGFPLLPGGGPFPMTGFPMGGSPILTPPLGAGTFDPFMGGTLTPTGFSGF